MGTTADRAVLDRWSLALQKAPTQTTRGRYNGFGKFMIRVIWLTCFLAPAVFHGLNQPAMAQTSHPSGPKKVAGPAVTSCGKGVTLSVSSSRVSQGSLVLAEVRSGGALTSVKGNWTGREVGFWEVARAESGGKIDRWRGLVGVDLEKEAGIYDLTVYVSRKDGDAVGCGAKVTVVVGRFPTERLKVENQFVEPDPEQADRAKKESAWLRGIYDTVTPDRLWKGPFRLPLDGVTTGGNFGRRRVLNGQSRSPHAGVDFASPTGTPVHATQDGQVVLAEPLFFSGNTVIIDHGLGIYTFYGHLSEIAVKSGEAIEVGEVLGKVGATGRVTGPHLHWALSVNRARVNAVQLTTIFGAR